MVELTAVVVMWGRGGEDVMGMRGEAGWRGEREIACRSDVEENCLTYMYNYTYTFSIIKIAQS